MDTPAKNKAYWRKNLQYLAILLGIWFITSYLCSVVFVEQLNKIRIGDVRLGSILRNRHQFGFSLYSSSSMPG